MVATATNSSFDVAYWFFNRAEADGIYLEDEKLHHLLFIAQCKYIQTYQNKLLMPCVFACNNKGFFEPNVKKIFEQGRPYMPPIKLDDKVSAFLNDIWSKFGQLSILKLSNMITQIPLYKKNYSEAETNVISWDSLIDKSLEYGTISAETTKNEFKKKVLVSQNGPVVVSQWKPRKINDVKI